MTAEVRVTFHDAAPLFQHQLIEELRAEGLSVVEGPPPMEERGVREALEVVNLSIYVLIGGATVVSKVVQTIRAVLDRSDRHPRVVVPIYGKKGEVLEEVHVPRKDEPPQAS